MFIAFSDKKYFGLLVFQNKRNRQTVWNAIFGEDFALAGLDAGFDDC